MIAWLFYAFCILVPGSLHSNAQTFHRFLHATYAHAQKDFTRSQTWFEKLHTKQSQTGNPWYLKGYVQLLADMNELFTIEEQIPLLDIHFAQDISVQMAIAKALQNTGKPVQARQRIVALHTNHSSDPELTIWAVQAAVASHDIAGAINLLERFVNTNPRKATHATFYLIKAQLHHAHKQPLQALTAIQESIECNPRLHNAWLIKAQLEQSMGYAEEAQKSYSQALKLAQQLQMHTPQVQVIAVQDIHPASAQASADIDKYATEAGPHKVSKDTLKKIYRHAHNNPQDDEVRVKTVQMLLYNKEKKAARDLLAQALERQPTETQWYILLLSSIDTAQEVTLVESQLRTIAERHPSLAAPYLFLAQLSLATGNEQTANQSLEMVLRNASNPLYQNAALYLQALLALKQNNISLAISLLQQAHNLPIQTPKTDLLLLSLYRQHRPSAQQALQMADILLHHQPRNQKLLQIKTELLLRADKPAEAIASLHTLAALQPANQQIQLLLCGTLYQCGQQQDALKILNKNRMSLFRHHKRPMVPLAILQFK